MYELLNQLLGANEPGAIVVYILIGMAITFVISHWGKVIAILDYFYNYRKNREELLETIEDSKKRIDQFEQNRIHDREQSFEIQKALQESISKIADAIDAMQKEALDEKIERMRWQILDFSNSVANGKKCHIEQYENVIKTYDKYEKILQDHDMTNGVVEQSMEFIREKYQEVLHGEIFIEKGENNYIRNYVRGKE